MSVAWVPAPWGLGAINWERKKIGREEERTGGAVSHKTKQLGFNLMAGSTILNGLRVLPSSVFSLQMYQYMCTERVGPWTCWALGGCTPRHGLGPALFIGESKIKPRTLNP